MKTKDEMIALNQDQARFYDSIQEAEAERGGADGYGENKHANFLTRLWAKLRDKQQKAIGKAGIKEKVREKNIEWLKEVNPKSTLEVGCFTRSQLTFDLAAHSKKYTGIELSPNAVQQLRSTFEAMGLDEKAHVVAGDLLAYEPDEKFDLIYAHGVLHHFENTEILFQKLSDLSTPDATLIFVEPSAINPLYQFIRALYRPFQSDKAWEWPFNKRTLNSLERHFVVKDGFGWGRHSLLLSVMTGLPLIGSSIERIYLKVVDEEVSQGWHSKIWNNSYVTARLTRKPKSRLQAHLPAPHEDRGTKLETSVR